MLQENLSRLKIGGAIVLFDRDFGKFFFQDFKVYGNLLDDAEWLLERTGHRSWGFMIRPVIQDGRYGLWIGKYAPQKNQVIDEEIIFNENSSHISKILFEYANHKISEREIKKRLSVEILKKKLPESRIIQGFKYYTCPAERFYKKCRHINEIYRVLRERYGSGARVRSSQVAEIISTANLCKDVQVCPLTLSPNAFERVITLDKALRSRKIGEIRIISGDIMLII